MFANEFIFDFNDIGMWLVATLEFFVIIAVFVVFNIVYLKRKYLKKSFKLLITMIFYQFCMLMLESLVWSYLDETYNRVIDIFFSFGVPFFFLGSMTALYLVIKKNKWYLLLYTCNILIAIFVIFCTARPTILSDEFLNSDTLLAPLGIAFLISNYMPLIAIFKYIKED